MGANRSPGVTVICQKCGQAFHPWHANRPGKFCSRACAPRGRQPTLVDIPCEACGVLFRPVHKQKRFCSRKCYRESPTWRRLNAEGYVFIYRPEHPRAYPSGQIFEHRIVMEAKIGRYLEPHETVHHINGIKTDNRPENLQLRSGKHGSGVVHVCLDCGSHNVAEVAIA